MIAQPNQLYTSPEAYLEGEKVSPVKHEYINGYVYAMAGTSDSHALIITNLIAMLRPHLRNSGCLLMTQDMKVKISLKNIFYYPDALVTCDDRDQANRYFKEYPKLIIEVLSDSTEKFDRGQKFADYREILSLEEYVLIAQDQPQVEVFRRNVAGRWELYDFRGEGQFELASLGLQADVMALYEDVIFQSEQGDSVRT
jgi:Uma2 family endonuclease